MRLNASTNRRRYLKAILATLEKCILATLTSTLTKGPVEIPPTLQVRSYLTIKQHNSLSTKTSCQRYYIRKKPLIFATLSFRGH